jgi:uncharacterized protein with HEPN domain
MRPDTLAALQSIRESVAFIIEDTAGMDFDAFERDRRTRQLVVHDFEVIGEAVNRLRRHGPSVAQQISAHNRLVAFRNVLIHGYDVIAYPTVWWAVQESLPTLRKEVEALLSETKM